MPAVLLALLLLTELTPLAQVQKGGGPGAPPPGDPTTVRLPDGKIQSEEILKAEHKKTIKDADDLVRLTQEVRKELDENEYHVLSIGLLKKLDEIEKITKRMRSRVKR